MFNGLGAKSVEEELLALLLLLLTAALALALALEFAAAEEKFFNPPACAEDTSISK